MDVPLFDPYNLRSCHFMASSHKKPICYEMQQQRGYKGILLGGICLAKKILKKISVGIFSECKISFSLKLHLQAGRQHNMLSIKSLWNSFLTHFLRTWFFCTLKLYSQASSQCRPQCRIGFQGLFPPDPLLHRSSPVLDHDDDDIDNINNNNHSSLVLDQDESNENDNITNNNHSSMALDHY